MQILNTVIPLLICDVVFGKVYKINHVQKEGSYHILKNAFAYTFESKVGDNSIPFLNVS